MTWTIGASPALRLTPARIWRANFGGAQSAAALAHAGLAPSTAAETPEATMVMTGLIAADQPSENVMSLYAAGSGVINASALTRGPQWFVLADGELSSSNSRREANKPVAATDAALAEWAPRHRSSLVADDISAALAANGHGSAEPFVTPDRPGRTQRSLSLRDAVRLSISDEVMESLDRA